MDMIKQISHPHENIIDLPIINLPLDVINVYERRIEDNPEEKNSGIFTYFQHYHSTSLD